VEGDYSMMAMPRVNKILQHPSYEEYTYKNKQAEEQRIYCRHGADHGLAVARIAYIYILEEFIGMGTLKEIDTFKEIDASKEMGSSKIGANLEAQLERAFGLNKEMIYAAGILHDIGRWVEYATKEDHAHVGAGLAQPILQDCGFSEEEIDKISLSISEHRLEPNKTTTLLGKALALADDWARDCKNCASQTSCYKYTKAMEEILI